MRFASRVRRPLAVIPGFALAALIAGGALAQQDKADKDKDKGETSKKVKFHSYDGVELSGTFYPKPAGGKDKDELVQITRPRPA